MTSASAVATSAATPVPARRARLPWTWLLALALLLAAADDFWATVVHGAIGGVARVQEPFSWWLTHLIPSYPVFAVGVIAVLVLAARRRWSRRRGRLLVPALLVLTTTAVAAGIVVIDAVYEYELQAGGPVQVSHAEGAHEAGADGTAGVAGVAGAAAAPTSHSGPNQSPLPPALLARTRAVETRAVVVAVPLLLVTNLVVVGWAAALRGRGWNDL